MSVEWTNIAVIFTTVLLASAIGGIITVFFNKYFFGKESNRQSRSRKSTPNLINELTPAPHIGQSSSIQSPDVNNINKNDNNNNNNNNFNNNTNLSSQTQALQQQQQLLNLLQQRQSLQAATASTVQTQPQSHQTTLPQQSYTQNTNLLPTSQQMPPIQSNIFKYPQPTNSVTLAATNNRTTEARAASLRSRPPSGSRPRRTRTRRSSTRPPQSAPARAPSATHGPR